MSEPNDRTNILIVDDQADKVTALEAVLEDLGQNIVRAYSGKQALRCLLHQDFAVVLLDVNMPGMDGFETAALIRQRQKSSKTPIIFVTAFGDDAYAAKGYSLGAVDYILAPVVPEILRTKVRVFVDLYKRNQEVERQSERLKDRAAQLHKLTRASLAIHSALSVEETLRVAVNTAREIIGANHAWALSVSGTHKTVVVSPQLAAVESTNGKNHGKAHASSAVSSQTSKSSPLDSFLCRANRLVRMTAAELETHPAWIGQKRVDERASPRGLLAAPLTERDGRNMGLIRLSDKQHGEFTEEDEAVLVQLAQMTSIAIENTLFMKAREANRLKDEFLATLSHELRTPLNAILGWTRLLQMQSLPPEEMARGLEVIDRNARAQTKLIEDLLDVSRITNGKMQLSLRRFPLSTVIQASIDAARPAAEAKNISMHCGPIPSQDEIEADPDRLQQVVGNLLANAVKFTPDGGHVAMSVERTRTHFRIRVSDTGKGISAEFLPHVFDRFRQAESSTTRTDRGLGIGLAIVMYIVELHHGTVQAESEGEGMGSAFTVTLPTSPRQLAGAQESTSPTPAVQSIGDLKLAGVRVLVVEDEPDARDLLARTLQRYHAQVIDVGSAREAMEALRTVHPHVLVSDISMPVEDGYSLIDRIRKLPFAEGGKIPALALTAHAREEDRIKALSAGFQVHRAKPIEPADLASIVARLAAAAGHGGIASTG